jgi:hypothetical protein
VTGLEVTISSNVEMEKNTIYRQHRGRGPISPERRRHGHPPGLVPGGWELSKNTISDNNRAQLGPAVVACRRAASGGGMLVLGVDGSPCCLQRRQGQRFLRRRARGLLRRGGRRRQRLPTSVPAIVQGNPEASIFEKNE